MNPRPVFLTEQVWFPDPRHALRGEFDGLAAIGGDFSVPRLLLAYKSGLFPWTSAPITWWSPDPRAIIELDAVHIPRSLARALRQSPFTLTRDRAFLEVMRGCAASVPGRPTTWISEEFIAAYHQLHLEGHAHSVECWQGRDLVGGIYGVAIGGFFAGESMFHRANNASKVALVHLLEYLAQQGYTLFDTQVPSPTTGAMGATLISREDYLTRLASAVQRVSCKWQALTNEL